MTPEQKAAFINAQSVMAQIELQGMIAENTERERNGMALAYTDKEFLTVYNQWENILGYNEIISFFRH